MIRLISIGRTFDDLHIPDEIVEHYKFLLQKTEKMRKLPVHHGAGYNGPWIENHYISHFMHKPLSYFNGLVPLVRLNTNEMHNDIIIHHTCVYIQVRAVCRHSCERLPHKDST